MIFYVEQPAEFPQDLDVAILFDLDPDGTITILDWVRQLPRGDR